MYYNLCVILKIKYFLVTLFSEDFIEMDEKKLKLLRTYENTDIEFTIVKNLGGKNHYLIKCPFLENILK